MNLDEAEEGNRRVFLASSFHAAFGSIVTGIETATQALQTQTLISRRTVEKGIAGITLLTVAGVVIGGGNPNILSTPRSPIPIAHPNETPPPPTEDLAFSEINNNKQIKVGAIVKLHRDSFATYLALANETGYNKYRFTYTSDQRHQQIKTGRLFSLLEQDESFRTVEVKFFVTDTIIEQKLDNIINNLLISEQVVSTMRMQWVELIHISDINPAYPSNLSTPRGILHIIST